MSEEELDDLILVDCAPYEIELVSKAVSHIENLQKENKNLKEIEKEHHKLNADLRKQNKDLQQRINKAIEIIDYRLKENDNHLNVHMEMFHYRNLKEILKSDVQETNPYSQYWFNQCMVSRKILITLEKWLDEERKVTYRDAGHTQRAYQNCYDKLQELKKDSDNND